MKAACKVGAGLWTPIFFHSFSLVSFFLGLRKCLSTAEQHNLDRAGAQREPGRMPANHHG